MEWQQFGRKVGRFDDWKLHRVLLTVDESTDSVSDSLVPIFIG
jgi:hypothetical protein